jgi:hypothetical protein
MKRSILVLLALTGALFSLTADSCFLSTKTVEVPVRGSGDLLFTSQGSNPDNADSKLIDFAGLIEDLEKDSDFDALVSAHIENGYWRVARNGGAATTVLSGSITVQRESSAAPAVPLISYTSVAIASVLGDFKTAPLNSQGVDLLNQGFDQYLQAKALGQPLPDLRYRFFWNSHAEPVPVDFDWEGKVKFTLVGLTKVDVPEVL